MNVRCPLGVSSSSWPLPDEMTVPVTVGAGPIDGGAVVAVLVLVMGSVPSKATVAACIRSSDSRLKATVTREPATRLDGTVESVSTTNVFRPASVSMTTRAGPDETTVPVMVSVLAVELWAERETARARMATPMRSDLRNDMDTPPWESATRMPEPQEPVPQVQARCQNVR